MSQACAASARAMHVMVVAVAVVVDDGVDIVIVAHKHVHRERVLVRVLPKVSCRQLRFVKRHTDRRRPVAAAAIATDARVCVRVTARARARMHAVVVAVAVAKAKSGKVGIGVLAIGVKVTQVVQVLRLHVGWKQVKARGATRKSCQPLDLAAAVPVTAVASAAAVRALQLDLVREGVVQRACRAAADAVAVAGITREAARRPGDLHVVVHLLAMLRGTRMVPAGRVVQQRWDTA
eukprot:207915-Chlamydomonas_euryale.AAC.1